MSLKGEIYIFPSHDIQTNVKDLGRYYLSYSTGNTHKLCYAIGNNPYGPFTFQGDLLTPVLGWTTHHSIIEFDKK